MSTCSLPYLSLHGMYVIYELSPGSANRSSSQELNSRFPVIHQCCPKYSEQCWNSMVLIMSWMDLEFMREDPRVCCLGCDRTIGNFPFFLLFQSKDCYGHSEGVPIDSQIGTTEESDSQAVPERTCMNTGSLRDFLGVRSFAPAEKRGGSG
jgi:hypothetical protein